MNPQSSILNPQSPAGSPVVHLLTHYVRWWAAELREWRAHVARFPNAADRYRTTLKKFQAGRDHWIARLRAERRSTPTTRNS